MRIAVLSRPSATPWKVLAGRSSSPQGHWGSHRGGLLPNGTGTVRARPWPLWGWVRAPGGPPPSWCSPWLPAASVRQWCDSRRRITATGDNGFLAALVGIARGKGASGYIGDGASRWPAVHRLDSAHLFRLALEKAPAGSTLHAVADEGVPIRDIAEVIGRHLSLPVVSVAPEAAAEHFTWLADFLAADSPASAALTRELLGWHPAHPGLIEDLDKGHYFRPPSA